MRRTIWVTAILIGLYSATVIEASDYTGRVSLGYVWMDEEGNRATNQPTFNTYEGVAFSLRQFRLNMSNGTYLFGDLKNVTLNNRNIRAGISRPGKYFLSLDSRQYRRVYSADGSDFTQRAMTGGDAWVQPHKNLRLFGGYDRQHKRGTFVGLFDDIAGVTPRSQVDYTSQYYNAGVVIRDRQRSLQLEYKGSTFADDLKLTDDFKTVRYRVSGRAPVPNYSRLRVNGGFERYERRRETAGDSLYTSLGWGGLRINLPEGLSARYSFIWDRSRSTAEPVATDNIVNSISAEKIFQHSGGLSAGYRRTIKDDVFHEMNGNGFFAAGWVRPTPKIHIRADVGTSKLEDKNATTLAGDEDLTRFRISGTYREAIGKLRLKYENRSRKRDDIGSTIDFRKVGAALTLKKEKYGRLTVSYNYIQGDYREATGGFEFTDHLLDGLLESAKFYNAQALFGGSYLRSQKDLDLERFTVKAGGRYSFAKRYTLEVIYTAHNFDDLLDANSPGLYTQFYTANIVEVNLITELGIQ